MREPDCILLRMGEAALKSEQVQEKWARLLQENIKAALEKAGVKADLEANPNRVFVYTGQLDEAIKALKKVFGITSMSPAWVTQSRLDSISSTAVDFAKEVLNLKKSGSFAIRAHRAGRHKFTSKEVAEVAGAAVKKVTKAKVDLDEPKHEIEIEVRSRRSYIIKERTDGPGGLPLGSGGKALALLSDEDLAAAWLIAKRGIELMVIAKLGTEKLVHALKAWHVGREMAIVNAKDFEGITKLADEKGLNAVVTGENTAKAIKTEGLLVLRPLVGMTGQERAALSLVIKS